MSFHHACTAKQSPYLTPILLRQSASKAWYTEDPLLGRCVERTLLLWAPCLVLWLCGPFYSLALRRRHYDPVPRSALAYTKVVSISSTRAPIH